MVDPRRGPRLVLAAAALIGVVNLVALPLLRPAQLGLATDVYYHAASTALAGGDFYAVAPPAHPGYRFLYPPGVALAFVPHALLGDPALAFALQTALNVAAALALAALLCRTAGAGSVRLAGPDRLLVLAAVLLSAHAATNLLMGQVNHLLALGVAAGALLVLGDRETTGGALLGGAAAVKLFPALVGVWLLRQRAWRAVLTATLAGLGVLFAGLFAFGPDAAAAYLTGPLAAEAARSPFAGGPAPSLPYATVRRQLALLPWLPAAALLPAGVALLTPPVAASLARFRTRRDRLVALQAVLTATLLLFPLEPFYQLLAVFPAVALLYRLDPGPPRTLFLAGFLLSATPVRLDAVATWAGALPPDLGAALLGVARAAFSVALPATVGAWAMLLACAWRGYRSAR